MIEVKTYKKFNNWLTQKGKPKLVEKLTLIEVEEETYEYNDLDWKCELWLCKNSHSSNTFEAKFRVKDCQIKDNREVVGWEYNRKGISDLQVNPITDSRKEYNGNYILERTEKVDDTLLKKLIKLQNSKRLNNGLRKALQIRIHLEAGNSFAEPYTMYHLNRWNKVHSNPKANKQIRNTLMNLVKAQG
jgi:hypothetical protein